MMGCFLKVALRGGRKPCSGRDQTVRLPAFAHGQIRLMDEMTLMVWEALDLRIGRLSAGPRLGTNF
jgi:hypothetical protein